MSTALAIIFCAAGMGLVLFAVVVAVTEIEERRMAAEQAGPVKRRNRRRGR